MAEFTGIAAAKAQEILNGTIKAATLNQAGHLILIRQNDEQIDAGDFSTVIGNLVSTAVTNQLNQTSGRVISTDQDAGQLVLNANGIVVRHDTTVKVNVDDDITFVPALMPSNPTVGFEFKVIFTKITGASSGEDEPIIKFFNNPAFRLQVMYYVPQSTGGPAVSAAFLSVRDPLNTQQTYRFTWTGLAWNVFVEPKSNKL